MLKDKHIWWLFYDHKEATNYEKLSELKEFIESEKYNQVTFTYPRKISISKHHSKKKRIVYSYSIEENFMLKLLTFILQRRFDGIFSNNLYSFRPNTGAKEAIYRLTRTKNISKKWFYKVDISDYFNSIPVEKILEKLNHIDLEEDVFEFIKSLLINPYVYENNQLIEEKKGIMAGTPISTFLANVYLKDMDEYFEKEGKLYARYSDDIIIFSDTKEQLEKDILYIHQTLENHGLAINPKKEERGGPEEAWTFLGVTYQQGTIDVAGVSVEKLKAKMRRKARALLRWKARKKTTGKQAAKAFIRVFNQKLFENPHEHELTWVRWYYPMINTDVSLKILDHYAQQCIRYIVTGKHTKANYNFRYEEMKELGYQSLVYHYYKYHEAKEH